VLYSLLPGASCALVVTKDEARAVALPCGDAIADACADLRAEDRSANREGILARAAGLRRMLVDSLELPADTRRLLLAPDAVLAHLPWPLLFDRRRGPSVSLVPSATTYVRLLDAGGPRGKGMLALGNPKYELDDGDHRVRVYARGRPLSPLPGTADEVRSVAGEDDVCLLAEQATETRLLEELPRRERWRSVHLACHCVLNDERPDQSALALTPDEENDGFLTALDLSSTPVPSDLVVLSGCSTGRDRTVSGEGLLGLSRAAMIAGAPRVMASLWRVDDRATAGLMSAFYESWSEERAATEALRRAQAACEKEMPHPRDWSGWVVWGLPN
jgi:CHAT domain-containing protein